MVAGAPPRLSSIISGELAMLRRREAVLICQRHIAILSERRIVPPTHARAQQHVLVTLIGLQEVRVVIPTAALSTTELDLVFQHRIDGI